MEIIHEAKKYWLRGGLTGAVLACVVVFLFYSSWVDSLVPDIYNGTRDNVFLIIFLLTPIFLFGKSLAFMYVVGPGVWFILGSVLGWIYGKIKNMNKVIL